MALPLRDAERVLPTLRDKILSLDLLQLASHPVHKVLTFFFRMTHTLSGDEAGRINLV